MQSKYFPLTRLAEKEPTTLNPGQRRVPRPAFPISKPQHLFLKIFGAYCEVKGSWRRKTVACNLFGRGTGSWKGNWGVYEEEEFIPQLLPGRSPGPDGSCDPFSGSPGKAPSWHPLCLAFL